MRNSAPQNTATTTQEQQPGVTLAWVLVLSLLASMTFSATPGLITALGHVQLPGITTHETTAKPAKKADAATLARSFHPVGSSTFAVTNTKAGILGLVTREGLQVQTSPVAPMVSLTSSAFGRPDAMSHFGATAPAATDTTASLRHGGVIEWFQNTKGSLEHGWTISKRPTGHGRLNLDLGITGARVATSGPHALTFQPLKAGQPAGAAINYNNLVVRDASGVRLPSLFSLAPGGARVIVNDARAVYPIVIDPDLTSVQTLTTPPSANGSSFGSDVAVNGNWMAVKEPGAHLDPTSATRLGRIDVYHDATGNGAWQQVGTLDGSADQTTITNTGVALVVEPAGVTVLSIVSGSAIRVWTFAGDPETAAPNATPVLRQTVTGVVTDPNSVVGAPTSLAASGDLLVWGAVNSFARGVRSYAADGVTVIAPNEAIGAAQVFRRTGGFGTNYAFETQLDPPGGIRQPAANRDVGQLFGTSIAIDSASGLIVVGAPGDDGVQTHTGGTIAAPAPMGTSTNEGAADVFRYGGGTTWNQVGRIAATTTVPGAKFGSAIGLAGNGSIVSGAPNETVAGLTNVGAGYLFDKGAGDTWTQVQRILPDDPSTGTNEATANSAMGTRAAIDPSANRVYFSAPNQQVGASTAGLSGSVYAYARGGGNGAGTFSARLVPQTGSDQHGGLAQSFGGALAVTNNAVVVGAPGFGNANETLVGRVTTFNRTGTAYATTKEFSPDTSTFGDFFGNSVSQDGDTLAVALPHAVRGSGFGTGAVAVYHLTAGAWAFEQMLFPYSAIQTNDPGTWAGTIAVHVTRDTGGNDIGLTVAVGDWQDSRFDADGNNPGAAVTVNNAGSVAVFGRNGGPGTTWSGGFKIWAGGTTNSSPLSTLSEVQTDAQFGRTIAFTGDGSLLVGAPFADSNAGAVYRYDKGTPTTSVLNYNYKQKISPQVGTVNFGDALAADGTTVLVAPSDGTGLSRYLDGGPNTNLVTNGTYPLNLQHTAASEPIALSVVGNRFAVSGDPIDDLGGNYEVRVYRFVGGIAVRETAFRPVNFGLVGLGLDLNHGGTVPTLVVGSPAIGSGAGGDTSAYVAKVKSDGSAQWSKSGNLTNPEPAPDSQFGNSVTNWPLNGGAAIGAPQLDLTGLNSGAVFTYDTSGIVPPVGPHPTVDISIAPSIVVGATQVKTAGLPPSLLTSKSSTDGSVASTSIGSIDLAQPSPGSTTAAAPLSSIPLKSIPLKSIPLKSIPLSSIPLKSIGGWEQVLAGTAYADLPLQNVTLEDVYDLPSVQALTLGVLDLAGSPLKSIPLASIALGATPLKSIDLDPNHTGNTISEWCAALQSAKADTAALGLDCAQPTATSNDAVTVLSIGLRGAPLDALPLKSIPLKSIDLGALPLKSIPLKSIGIANTPLKSIPLKSIDLGSTPLKSIPLSSIPLKSIPLKSIPLSSIMLGGTPLKSIPLSSIDIDSTPLKSIPLKSIDLGSIPLSSIPLKSIPLKSIPLKSIDLTWFNVGPTPLKSIPLSSIDIGSTPLKSIPLKSIPLSSIPLSSIPLKSIPLKSIPLKSIDLTAITINGIPLKSIPLKSIDISTTPLKSIPLKSISAGQLATLVDCSLYDCTTPSATLADAATAGAIKPGATINDLGSLLTGLRLSDLIGSGANLTSDQLRAALGARSLADLNGYDDLQLGDMAPIWPYLTLGQIQPLTDGIRLDDLKDAIQELSGTPFTQQFNQLTQSLADVTDWDNVTLGDIEPLAQYLKLGDLGPALSGIRLGDLNDAISNADGHVYSSEDLRTALQGALGADAKLSDLTDLDNVTLGELGEYGDASLGDLLTALSAEAQGNLTLADLLIALLSPRQYPWEKLDVSQVTAQALDDTPNESPVTLAYSNASPDGLPRTVQVTVQLPHGARLETGTVDGLGDASLSELRHPVIDGDTATWTFTDVPANAPQTVLFNLQAPLTIGPAQLKATAFMPTEDETASDTAATVVHEAFEPNDTVAQATPLADDTITLSHISSATDIDVYKFDVTQPGTRVSISLSNLDADLDLVLYGPRDGTIVATSARKIDPVTDEGDNGLPAAKQSGSSPAQATSGNDGKAPTDLGTLAAVQGSFNRGTSDEQIDSGLLQKTGTYYLAVTGYNAAVDAQPYALRLKRFVSNTQPSCPARTVTPGTLGDQLPASLPAGTNTVFVVNRSRMEGLYGATAIDQMMSRLNGFSTWVNGQPATGVKAAVLTVDADPAIRSAYAQWDASPCLPAGANAVVSEVARVLNGYRTQGSALTNVVLVGGDDAVPFARVPDRTKVANESGYASTFSDAGNALYATFATSSLQTDNVYVDRAPYAFGDRALYVPDAAIARLVESPTEITDQLNDFQNANGLLAVHTGLVTGYDFLSDGATAVKNEVNRTYGTVDSHLISDTWTRQNLEDAIHTLKPDLLSINSHFDHYRALPGAGNTAGDESDLFTAAAVRGTLSGDLAGSVVFSMGCHSGLSASDNLLTGDRALDFAQAVSSQGGVFVGNTGFGYGDTDTVALSEQLMKEFAHRLDGSMSLGEALLYAKNAYFSGLAEFTPYDEKVLEETTFYGLPFYRLDVANPPSTPAPSSPVLTPDGSTGLDVATTHLAPTYATRTASNGKTYVAAVDPTTGEDGLTTVQNRPVEPKVDTEYALPTGKETHDSLVVGLTSVDTPDTHPYVFQPTVDSGAERADVGVDTAFPTRPARVNPGLSPAGATFHVAATTGYFRTTGPDGTGLQRTYKSMDLLTYLPPAGTNDFIAPTFSQVTGQVHDGMVSISAHVMDDRGTESRVKRVRLLLVQDPRAGVATSWRGLDLVRTAGSDEWTGSLPTTGRNLEFILQAVDAAGNVGVTTDKASNFSDAAVVGAVSDAGGSTGTIGDLQLTLAGPLGGEGWYTGPVTVTAAGGVKLVYEVVGESDPTGYQEPFQVTGTGLHTVRVTSGDGQTQTVTIPVDTVGPAAQLASPAVNQTMPAAPGALISFSCPDAGSGSTTCTATLDGNAVTTGTTVPLPPGTHTVVVTAGPDRAGNPPSVPTLTRTFTVLGAPATVGSIGVAKAQDGSPTTLTVPFSGYSVLTYSGTVAWGDGATTNCAMAGSGCTVTRNGSGGGTLTASHTYGTAPVDTTATVTVSDNLGQTASATTKVNRKTTLTATAALLQLRVTTNIIELKSGAISATLKDGIGAPIGGQTIKFTLPSGTTICTATTNSSGTATCPSNLVYTTLMILAGRYNATYAGKDVFKGSTASASLIG